MFVGVGRLHRQECSCADMKGQFVGLDAPAMEVCEDGFGKMQAGCWSSDRTFDTRINGLVGLEVGSFGLAVQVRRNGQFACGIENLREGDVISVEKLGLIEGEKASFDKVLMVSGETGVKAGNPFVEGASVVATVLEEGRGKKVIVYKYKAKKGYHKKNGHRQYFTKLKIDSINA